MNHNPNCPECKGTGEVMLLTSKAPCACRTDVSRIHDEVLAPESTGVECLSCGDEAHDTRVCPHVSMKPCPMQERDRQPVTYSLELRTPHSTHHYTGLSQGDCDTAAHMQRSGFPYDQTKDHLDECQINASIRERQSLGEQQALGFTLGELEAASVEIRKDIEENCTNRREVLDAVCRGVIRLMVRRTINGVMRASSGKTQFMRQMMANNLCNVHEAFDWCSGRDVDYSELEMRLAAHFAGGSKVQFSFAPEESVGVSPRGCGKAEFFRQLYGGGMVNKG